MDINRLCPGCMQDLGDMGTAGIQGREMQEPQRTDIRNVSGWESEAQNVKMRRQGKCPYCGFDPATYRENARCLPLYTILAGKYLVGAVLGEGGFGITYMGYDLNMQTRIAIKEYFPVELVSRDTTSLTGDRVISLSGEKSATYQQGLQMYVIEAQNVSQFSETPGVVAVKDFFYENETAYIVMEYIDGISLKDYLKERGGRLSETEALAIMKPILEALVKVHEAGIIHRDISPDNIMLTFSGEASDRVPVARNTRSNEGGANGLKSAVTPGNTASKYIVAEHGRVSFVKLIDFGAARMTAKNDQKSLTIILKHGYAPEEQYRTHGEQGPWTDVYAVCAVFYRMLTGQTPVSAMDRLFQDNLKSFEALSANVSRSTQTAILKGLAVKKEDRIQNTTELIQILYEGKTANNTFVRHRHKKRWLTAIIAVTSVVLLSGTILVSIMRKTAPNTSVLLDELETAEPELMENVAEERRGSETESGGYEDGKTELDSSEPETAVIWQEKGEELEPQIVWPEPGTMIAAGLRHVLSLREDGTVFAAGSNTKGQCNVEDWEHVAAVYAFRNLSAGLSTDGKVFVAGNPVLEEGVEAWRGVISLALGDSHIVGILEDGTVISAGNNDNGRCDTGDWKDIVSVCAGSDVTIGVTTDGRIRIAGDCKYEEDMIIMDSIGQWTDIKEVFVKHTFEKEHAFYGLKKDGTVLCAGQPNAYDGRTDIADIATNGSGWSAALLKDGSVLAGAEALIVEKNIWTDIVALAVTQDDIIGLGQDGCIKITEFDTREKTANALEEIRALENVAQIVWGYAHLAIRYNDGTVRTITYGGHSSDRNNQDTENWTDMSQIGVIFDDGIAGLTSDQRVIIAESGVYSYDLDDLPEGASWEEMSEETVRRIEQTPDLTKEWNHVTEISCSENHIAALMEDGTVKAAGDVYNQEITDYRTGLTKDGACETEFFTDIRQIAAINGRTVGLKEDGTLTATGNMPEEWKTYTSLASIWKGTDDILAALREDGTVQHLSGSNQYGQQNTMGWNGLIQLALSNGHTVGLKGDGTVVAVGTNYCGQCDVEDWRDVVSISAGPSSTMGITSDGRVLMAGTLPNDYFGAEKWPPIPIADMMAENP